ncbi:hypothetical protein [Deinococcus aquaticus]|uniref:hypothetical protein n=1 Tax=Deinococcus aquaticus TaxID=328692 RepID=UPI003F44B2DE
MTRFPALPALLGSALLAGALASCAPALTGLQTGRIVNTRTGQEGTVTFVRGSLNARLPDVFAPDNATIVIGERTYTGRTYLLDGVASPLPAGSSLSVGFGASTGGGNAGDFGFGTRFDTGRPRLAPTRTGNLIARVQGDAPGLLTCTLTVDAQERGIGECFDGAGTRYALQF